LSLPLRSFSVEATVAKQSKRQVIEKRRRLLDVCTHGDCEDHRVHDLATCWKHATAQEKADLQNRVSSMLRAKTPLRGIVLTGANFAGFDFSGADLQEAFLDKCNLIRCDFTEANLRRAYLGWSILENANLTRAELDAAVFSLARLPGSKLLAYSISFGRTPINLAARSFAPRKGFGRAKIDESNPALSGATYQALKRYFVSEGDYESASWASYCESVMRRRRLWTEKRRIRSFFNGVFGFICGYGEKPVRVLLCDAAIIFCYAAAYRTLNIIPNFAAGGATSWLRGIYFSAATFSAYSFADVIPKGGDWMRLLVSSESVAGVLLLGLFLFTLTKRYVMR
jgi:hypothetical protein